LVIAEVIPGAAGSEHAPDMELNLFAF
jgi:hypothetical protein